MRELTERALQVAAQRGTGYADGRVARWLEEQINVLRSGAFDFTGAAEH